MSSRLRSVLLLALFALAGCSSMDSERNEEPSVDAGARVRHDGRACVEAPGLDCLGTSCGDVDVELGDVGIEGSGLGDHGDAVVDRGLDTGKSPTDSVELLDAPEDETDSGEIALTVDEIGDEATLLDWDCVAPDPWSLAGTCNVLDMPPCDYDAINCYYPCPYMLVFQFEEYHPESSLFGLPPEMICGDVPPYIILRIRWEDTWAGGAQGGVPCGGHCFPTMAVAYAIDPVLESVVAAGKETFEDWYAAPAEPTLSNCAPSADGTYCVDLPELGKRFKTGEYWYPEMGLEPVIADAVEIMDFGTGETLGFVDLPLF